MKAFILTDKNGIDSIKLDPKRALPMPEANEIRVKVKAVGLNPVDYQLAEGWENISTETPPVLGLDVAGEVDDTGKDVKEFEKGDRVFYHGNLNQLNGGYAEYSCTTAHTVTRLPEEISFVQAAALPCPGYAAYQAVIQKLKPSAGDTILVHCGAGGVGGYAIQLAKACGLTVYTTCSSKNNDYVKSLGADAAIDYTKEDVTKRVLELTGGRGLDCIINTISSESATEDLSRLAFSGQLVSVEGLPDLTAIGEFEKAVSVHEIAVGAAYSCNDIRAEYNLANIGAEYVKLIQEGKVKFPKITQIKFEEIPEFLKLLQKRHVSGKIVAVL